jgi:hypothetical protein
VDFDPKQVTYEELVRKFYAFHDATRSSSKRQYMSAIFVHDDDQERVARAVTGGVQAAAKDTIRTAIVQAGTFYLAEAYHQKYALQGNPSLMEEYRAIYPDIWDMVDSTAATRVNAYLYGFGSPAQLAGELKGLGLSESGRERVRSARPAGSCPVG